MGAQVVAMPVAEGEQEPQGLTLLELVKVISEITEDEREIVATVVHMLQSGRVRLTGNFRDAPIEWFQAS